MKLQTSLLTIFLGLSSLTLTQAQTYDGFHEHDGFYLSMATGFGGGNAEWKTPPNKLEVSGGSSHIDLKVGGAVIKNRLILSGDFIGSRMFNPDVKYDGTNVGRSNDDVSQGMLGLGVTYYFMPVNFFLSGTLGAGGFAINANNADYKSERGPGFQLKLGKEWWVSRDWGLGVSAFVLHQHVNQSSNTTFDGGFFGLMFNTTFN